MSSVPLRKKEENLLIHFADGYQALCIEKDFCLFNVMIDYHDYKF